MRWLPAAAFAVLIGILILNGAVVGILAWQAHDRLPAPSWPEGYQDYFDRHNLGD